MLTRVKNIYNYDQINLQARYGTPMEYLFDGYFANVTNIALVAQGGQTIPSWLTVVGPDRIRVNTIPWTYLLFYMDVTFDGGYGTRRITTNIVSWAGLLRVEIATMIAPYTGSPVTLTPVVTLDAGDGTTIPVDPALVSLSYHPASTFNVTSTMTKHSVVGDEFFATITGQPVISGSSVANVINVGDYKVVARPALNVSAYYQIYWGDMWTSAGVPLPGVMSVVDVLPRITPGQSFTLVDGVAFSRQVTYSGTRTSWSATGLPAGLTINTATGVVSGTPTGGTSGGTVNASITAVNSYGTDTETVGFVINPTLALQPRISAQSANDFVYSGELVVNSDAGDGSGRIYCCGTGTL
jgi:hypothetical protein